MSNIITNNKFAVAFVSTFYTSIFLLLSFMVVGGSINPIKIALFAFSCLFINICAGFFFRKSQLIFLKWVILQIAISFACVITSGICNIENNSLKITTICIIIILLFMFIRYVLKESSVLKLSKIIKYIGYI